MICKWVWLLYNICLSFQDVVLGSPRFTLHLSRSLLVCTASQTLRSSAIDAVMHRINISAGQNHTRIWDVSLEIDMQVTCIQRVSRTSPWLIPSKWLKCHDIKMSSQIPCLLLLGILNHLICDHNEIRSHGFFSAVPLRSPATCPSTFTGLATCKTRFQVWWLAMLGPTSTNFPKTSQKPCVS